MNTQVNQSRMNVDLSSALDIACEQCACKTFVEVAFVKKISALLSPNGKETVVPVGTFACSACGHVNAEFDPFRPPLAK